MKNKFQHLKLFLPALLIITALSSYAQEFTLTTTSANVSGYRALIDLPGLSGDPVAIILVTPLGNTATLNPHPIGAYYNQAKWWIINLDQKAIIPGLTYKVQYYLNPGPNQFLHLITTKNMGRDGSYIDNPALNNNPNAQFKIFQNWAPEVRAGGNNRYETKVGYSSAAGRWYITNVNNERLEVPSAYNIVITGGGTNGPNTSTPLSTVKTQTTKSIQLTFDNLNDFVEKGLPDPALAGTSDMDFKAVMMAQKILKLDSNSLPVLITALQTAGFFIIDENRKILRKPPGDGKGQGLAFYDFETVGMLKLENHGITSSLNKVAGLITKNNTFISASEFSQLMLKDLQQQALNPTDSILRFWARLIIELGRSSRQNVDLMTATSEDIPLNMLQVSLWTRRLTGDFYALNKSIQAHGFNQPSTSNTNPFVFASWNQNEPQVSQPNYSSPPADLPCDLTNDESLIMDASANLTTAAQGWAMDKIGGMIKSASGMAGFSKLVVGLYGANLALAWLKLVAALTMLQGEITVDKTPLVRTMNSVPGERCLMKARIWSTVGKVQMLNCVRLAINAATGLDFNLPTDGPLADVAVQWQFAGENETPLSSQKFVFFEPPPGADRKPNKQVTDDKGISMMYLVGSPKIPEVGSRSNVKVPKTAKVLVGVTLKSAKDVKQNFIDIGGIALGIATGGPLGILTAMPEIGFRLPWTPARASIPVIDHEPCNGQWFGTITYTYIATITSNQTISPPPSSGRPVAGITGGHSNQNTTITQSGTVTVNGNEGLANSSADEIFVSNESSSGKAQCHGGMGPPKPLVPWSSKTTAVRNGGGTSEGKLTAGISLDKDSYKISIKPLTINGTVQSTTQNSVSGGCGPNKPSTSFSNSSNMQYGSNDYIVGRANYGADRNILSGSDTKTISVPPTTSQSGGGGLMTFTTTASFSYVTTITWNLRRCN